MPTPATDSQKTSDLLEENRNVIGQSTAAKNDTWSAARMLRDVLETLTKTEIDVAAIVTRPKTPRRKPT